MLRIFRDDGGVVCTLRDDCSALRAFRDDGTGNARVDMFITRAYEKGPLNRVGLLLNWEPGGVLLSHGEAPHYHRR